MKPYYRYLVFLSLLVIFVSSWLAFNLGTKRFSSAVDYCPDTAEETPVVDTPKPGCGLIYRAYNLGLIKNLGSCESTAEKRKTELCTLRQRDEPWLHYSYRLFLEAYKKSDRSWLHGSFWKKSFAVFKTKLGRVRELSSRTGQIVQGVPRASHHVFTNLPKPAHVAESFLSHWIAPEQCLAHYAAMGAPFEKSPQTEESAPQNFDEVYGYLLFSHKYRESGGLCTENTIHWGAPADTCQRLAGDPERFLKSFGLRRSVNVIIDRLKDQRELNLMQLELRTLVTGLPPPPPPTADKLGIVTGKKVRATPIPPTVISFQCVMQDEQVRSLQVKDNSFQFAGYSFTTRTVMIPKIPADEKAQIDLYKAVSVALAPAFKYVPQDTAANAASPVADAGSLFGSGDFPFARLEYLKHLDIFKDEDWIKKREDLLEIYPYSYHLNHFVESFREDYVTQRTRL